MSIFWEYLVSYSLLLSLFLPPMFKILWEFKTMCWPFSSWFGYFLGCQFHFGLLQRAFFGELHVIEDQSGRVIMQENCALFGWRVISSLKCSDSRWGMRHLLERDPAQRVNLSVDPLIGGPDCVCLWKKSTCIRSWASYNLKQFT